MSVEERKNVKYELVAPDGGWGYMIGLGVIVNWITIASFVNCFGMLFNELFIEINMDSTAVGIFNGVGAFSIAIAGFLVSSLQRCMSLRQLGLLAAFIFNLGIFCTIFVKSEIQFIITQGILQGFGNGLIFNVSCTMLNNYFVRRRLLAFSVTQCVAAIFCMISPQFVKWSIQNCGSQGTLLLVSAISLHNICAMALMQPVAWHMKKVEVLTEEKEMKSLLTEDNKDVINNELKFPYKSNQMESFPNDHSRIKIFLSRIVDFSLLKTYVLTNACVGLSLCACLELVFITMLPQSLYNMGWDESRVAMALSLNATADLLTRIVLILMNNLFMKIGSHEIYVGGVVIAFVSRIGMLWSNNNTVIIVFITIMGVSRCILMLFLPVVVADSVAQEKFTSAMGLMMLLFGVFNCTVGPVIGAIRDLTNSYSTAFYVLTSCFGVIVVTWSIELLYKRTKRKRQLKLDISLQT